MAGDVVRTIVVFRKYGKYLFISFDGKFRKWLDEDQLSSFRIQVHLGGCYILHLENGNVLHMERKNKNLKFDFIENNDTIIIKNIEGIVRKKQQLVYFEVEEFGDVAYTGSYDVLRRQNIQIGSKMKLRMEWLYDQKHDFLQGFEWGAELDIDKCTKPEIQCVIGIVLNNGYVWTNEAYPGNDGRLGKSCRLEYGTWIEMKFLSSDYKKYFPKQKEKNSPRFQCEDYVVIEDMFPTNVRADKRNMTITINDLEIYNPGSVIEHSVFGNIEDCLHKINQGQGKYNVKIIPQKLSKNQSVWRIVSAVNINGQMRRWSSRNSINSNSQHGSEMGERRSRNMSRVRNDNVKKERSKSAGPLRKSYQGFNGSQTEMNYEGYGHEMNNMRQGRSDQPEAAKIRKRSKSVGDSRGNQYEWTQSVTSSNTSLNSNNPPGRLIKGILKNSTESINSIRPRSKSRRRRSPSGSFRTSSDSWNRRDYTREELVRRKVLIMFINVARNRKNCFLWDIENYSTWFFCDDVNNATLKVGHFFEGLFLPTSETSNKCQEYIRSLDGQFPEVIVRNVKGKIEVETSINHYDSMRRCTKHKMFGEIEVPRNLMIPRSQWSELRISIYTIKAQNGVGSAWRMKRIISAQEQLIDEFRAVWENQLFRKTIQADIRYDQNNDFILDRYYKSCS